MEHSAFIHPTLYLCGLFILVLVHRFLNQFTRWQADGLFMKPFAHSYTGIYSFARSLAYPLIRFLVDESYKGAGKVSPTTPPLCHVQQSASLDDRS